MPGLMPREFECSLCQTPFTMLSGDLLVPEPTICDDCLTAVWQLEDAALTQHIHEQPGVQSQDEAWVNRIVQHIKWTRGRWATADEAIRFRK